MRIFSFGLRTCRDYASVVLAWFLVYVELCFRLILALIPRVIRGRMRKAVRTLYDYFIFSKSGSGMTGVIQRCRNIYEICEAFGYIAEEHLVRTEDNFVLCLHHIVNPKLRNTSGKHRGVVYFQHGLMTNSELWVAVDKASNCLPFALVDRGYDVWLGNNRGNKYSRKHVRYSPNDEEFWDFCIDDMAMFDIPNSINYILSATKEKSLSYVGFSQGTAQAFAALSINPTLNEKINLFVALAPAFTPKGFSNELLDYLVKVNPKIMFRLFGRGCLLPSVTFWQNICYPPIYMKIVDISLKMLFDWNLANITQEQKICGYAHLYSFSSVKSCVHWLQIMQNSRFQLYDDDLKVIGGYDSRHYHVAHFPTRNIKCPITVVWGKEDTLVDMEIMLAALPPQSKDFGIDGYEHLDMLWAKDVKEKVFPIVFSSLEELNRKRPLLCNASPIGNCD
ncbi:triglyceride lipase-cholesterol esterase [Schizosaccharomyces japonicus yFS275]|uniref:Triglyceride lipase-cholesterol esterase n=1 Tax=Schizosaccharomyces japonicus (strain yFS275 / FY16936) TaxID=402676 RepID=B6K7S4_SCHJY|nr:triglyceride lipase-cholesterol esterase [Schizosaccharomyces japonicus yFS275]EEB09578.2 triglyceride lipase-cholesterol esterase [Schizosaccharomyces japonicus yFS275]